MFYHSKFNTSVTTEDKKKPWLSVSMATDIRAVLFPIRMRSHNHYQQNLKFQEFLFLTLIYVLKYTILATARTFRVMLLFRFSQQLLWRALSSEMWRVVHRKNITDCSKERAVSISARHLLLVGYLVGLCFYPDDGSRIFPRNICELL
jgi:hypothetical protein